MHASARLKIALATSLASARVGRGAVVIESSIWVATTTGLPAARAAETIRRWTTGTISGEVSTPRSPRATMTASAAAMMASTWSTASCFSILATMGITRSVMSARSDVDVVRRAHERLGDEVDVRRLRPLEQRAIVLGDGCDAQRDAGNVDALVTRERTAHFDAGHDVATFEAHDYELDAPVVEQDRVAERDVIGQAAVAHACPGASPSHSPACSTKLSPGTNSVPEATVPTRSLGPGRSTSTPTVTPQRFSAARTPARRATSSAGSEWEAVEPGHVDARH